MILGICGSPRSQATEYALKRALVLLGKEGHEVEYWGARGKNIGFCTHCDYCLNGEGCIVKDDVQELYPLLAEADAFIFATPVYNGAVSAQIKAVMDRSRALFAKNPGVFHDKVGIAIAVGGDRSGGQELAIQQIITYYTLTGVFTLSGGAFGSNLGASIWSKDTLEGAKDDEEGLKALRRTVKRLSKYLKEVEVK
ncbi:MAG: flavodoxin family protein [Candidatus Bathyarchaeota archaeon]|nr:flavodoxin family protein [Candidatus Bathyarchaeota archaeon]